MRQNSVAQCPQICHCEGALRPWQSREGATSSYRASIITHKPIASVAALIERHGGWQYLRHEFYGARFPSLSFRGAKRRGNLLQPVTFSPRPTCYPTWYCEIATSACGLLAMTNLGASRHFICATAIAGLQGAHRCLNSTNFIIARRRMECKPEIGQEFSLTCRNIRQRR